MTVAPGMQIKALSAGPNPIVLIGDSRTAQLNWSKVGPYPVINAGFGGYTVKNWLDLWNTDIKNTNWGSPVGAVIMLGVNDAYTPTTSPDYNGLNANYAALIAAVKPVFKTIITCTVMPLESGFYNPDTALPRVPYTQRVSIILRITAINGASPIVDLETYFSLANGTCKPGMTQEGTHLSFNAAVETKKLVDAAVWQYIPPIYSAPPCLPDLPPIGPTDPS